MQRFEAGVHELTTRKQIARGPPTQREHNGREQADGNRVWQAHVDGHGVRNVNEARQQSVVEARNAEQNRDVVQPGEIAAQDQRDLKQDCDCAGPIAKRCGREIKPRNDDLCKMGKKHARLMGPWR